jgi:hypothetical protein
MPISDSFASRASAFGPVGPLAFPITLSSIAQRSTSTSTINLHYQNESRLAVSPQRCDESFRTSTKGDGHTAPTRQHSGLMLLDHNHTTASDQSCVSTTAAASSGRNTSLQRSMCTDAATSPVLSESQTPSHLRSSRHVLSPDCHGRTVGQKLCRSDLET